MKLQILIPALLAFAITCIAQPSAPLWLQGGHAGKVGSVAWSADDSTIATASDDTTVKLWSADGKLLRTLTTQPYQATAVAFSPDSLKLAIGTYDGGYLNGSNGLGRVLLWQTTDGWQSSTVALVRTLTNRYGKINTVAFSANGAHLATGNASGSNHVHQIANGSLLAQRAAYKTAVGPAQSTSVAFSPSGWLASACEDGSILVCNSSYAKIWTNTTAHSSNATSVAFSPDGSLLASCGSDHAIRLWSTNGWNLVRSFNGHTRGVNAIAFSPDGNQIASVGDDQTLRLWQVTDGFCRTSIVAHASPVLSVAFSPDGTRIVTGGSDNDVKLWAASYGSLIQVLGDHADSIKTVAISPDGALCASAANDCSIQIRRASDGSLLRVLAGHTGCVSAIEFLPDNATLASAGGPLDPTIKLWRIRDGELLRTLEAFTNGVTSLAVSPDGTTIAAGGDFDEQTVRLWSSADGTLLQTLSGHSNGVTAVAFSADGAYLVSGGRKFDHTAKVWSLADGSLVRTFSGLSNSVEALAISPDGDTVAIGCAPSGIAVSGATRFYPAGNYLIVGRISDGSMRGFGNDTNPVLFVAFSPDGSTLASATCDAVKLWDVTTGVVTQVLTQEMFRVACAAFSPNGNLLAFGRQDATLGLMANAFGALGSPPLVFESLGFDADGRRLLQASTQPMTRYLVQSSTNLSDWQSLALVRAETNTLQFVDVTTNAFPGVFYRAITPP